MPFCESLRFFEGFRRSHLSLAENRRCAHMMPAQNNRCRAALRTWENSLCYAIRLDLICVRSCPWQALAIDSASCMTTSPLRLAQNYPNSCLLVNLGGGACCNHDSRVAFQDLFLRACDVTSLRRCRHPKQMNRFHCPPEFPHAVCTKAPLHPWVFTKLSR